MQKTLRILPQLSLRTRIMLSISVLIFILGFGATVYARRDLSRILLRETQEAGITLAQSLAVQSAPLLLTEDVFALYGLLNNAVLNSQDIRYVFILSPSGQVRYHTFEAGFPAGLKERNRMRAGEKYSLERIDTDEGKVIDIAVPILEGEKGFVRIGLAQERHMRIITQYVSFLILMAGLVILMAIIFSHFLSRVLTRPISALVQATRDIKKGQFSISVPQGKDEIGQLGHAFSSMASELASSRKELLNQNRELTILNKLSDVVSNTFQVEEVFHESLYNLKNMMALKTGWVLLKESQSGNFKLANYFGVSKSFALGEVTMSRMAGCICWWSMREKKSQVLKSHSQCPRYKNITDMEEVSPHFSIPLLSKGEVLGTLNLSPSEPTAVDFWRLDFLDRIGQQVGLAVERAKLYQEVLYKEELHANLLKKVISAQEEERKRIARELHDDVGQILSRITSSLGGIEESKNVKRDIFERRMSEVKSDSTHALQELRRTILNLRPTVLDDLGLVAALRWYVRERLQEAGIRVNLEIKGLKERFSPEIEITLFRVIQESLNNISRHAKASNVLVRLELQNGLLQAEVHDDGIGFNVEKLMSSKDRLAKLGLMGMEERINLLNGSLKILSVEGKGTEVYMSIPIAES